MNDTEILLSNNTSNEEKREVANNIIVNYELPLSTEQILLAFKNVLSWLNIYNSNYYKNNRLFLFNALLKNNKNMYIALILALCDNFDPEKLSYFIIFNSNICPLDIGIDADAREQSMAYYYKLLDHYEFDVSNISGILEKDKLIIQEYRVAKYSGKLTKRAIKKLE